MFKIAAFFTEDHGGLVVGIQHRGMYCFRWPNEYLRFDYICEKLGLCEADGRNIADWINVQFGFEDAPQQGNYYLKCIRDIDPYGCTGEKRQMPLFPVLIEEDFIDE